MKYSRKIPGASPGVFAGTSRQKPALRMAMQTREQHIRRDKATSNICTAQALLANMASAYGVYHGPEGMKGPSHHAIAQAASSALAAAGYALPAEPFFDTLKVDVASRGKTAAEVQAAAAAAGYNVRVIDEGTVGLSFGEAHTAEDLVGVLGAFGVEAAAEDLAAHATGQVGGTGPCGDRSSPFMTHPIFNTHHSETQMLRYLKYLEDKDLALNHSMISLGSCTMKLNSTSEMIPVTWPEFCNMHPFAPVDQTEGYRELIASLHADLAEITGFAAVSSQPNSGASGEYAGLLCIREFHRANNEAHRNVCLIPISAHGTNPASAVMAGMKVVVIKSDEQGNVDLDDLRAKAEKHSKNLAALMVTYPSTYGVFEEGILEMTSIIKQHGGRVYMDGANMNAQVALTSPGNIGADVCHLNLHKTFCIPHGGGGPGVGTIACTEELAPYLPGHAVVPVSPGGASVTVKEVGRWRPPSTGSAILPISWMYIKMLGAAGLKHATATAILNANYMAQRRGRRLPVLYTGSNASRPRVHHRHPALQEAGRGGGGRVIAAAGLRVPLAHHELARARHAHD
ncbi:unnamed protein product [Heterosigma akashiwo]